MAAWTGFKRILRVTIKVMSPTILPRYGKLTFFPSIDTILMGRKTYETVASFDEWPFADKNVIVLSGRPSIDDGRVIHVGSLEQACQLLDEREAKEVYVDGGKTIQSFLAAGYLDEITVSIAPVLIGSGTRLFGPLTADIPMTVLGQYTTPEDGLVRITHTLPSPRTGS